MHTLETLFDPAQRTRLTAAVARRTACRAFLGAPDTAQWAKLAYLSTRYALPGVRLRLLHCPEDVFTGTIFNMGRISGCTTITAVCALDETGAVWAGAAGEALALEAVAMGLGTCWLTGTYRKGLVAGELRPEEHLLGILALGVPEKQEASEIVRRRKPLEKLCRGDVTLWPEEVRSAAELVRQAPSALNGQPWRMTLDGNGFEIAAPGKNALDLGIGLCHAELGLKTPHTWKLSWEGHGLSAVARV